MARTFQRRIRQNEKGGDSMTKLITKIKELEVRLEIIDMFKWTDKELQFMTEEELLRHYDALEKYRYLPPERNYRQCDFKGKN